MYSDLSDNDISLLRDDSLKGLMNTRKLRLNSNKISRIFGKPFVNLTHLTSLHLQHNLIDDSNLEFLGSSPLHTLDISHNSFTQFPNISNLSGITTLYAAFNSFVNITEDTFTKNRALEKLHLAGNQRLTSFDKKAFRESSHLQMMDLSHTSLERLPSFEHLKSLTELNLQHSKFRELPSDLCNVWPNLVHLYVSDNYLETIPDLSNCSELAHLELQFNHIQNITEPAFKGLLKLDTLLLYQNEITYIHPQAFHGLRYLQTLDLSHNSIGILHENFFFNLTHLRTLEIQFNQIRDLPLNIFKDVVRLQTLYINDNSINSVGHVIFPPNMTWLQYLNISNNPSMSKFPLPTHGFPFLRSLAMRNLPLILDVPTVSDVPRIQKVDFTYSYHCCIFIKYIRDPYVLTLQSTTTEGPTRDPTIHFSIYNTQADEVTLSPDIVSGLIFPEGIGDPFDHTDNTISPTQFINVLIDYQDQFDVTIVPVAGNKVAIVSNDNNGTNRVVGLLDEQVTRYLLAILPSFFVKQEVQCHPEPNSLTPCENLLDPQPLPVLVWFIWFVIAISNLAVLFVMLVSKEKIKVPQFFICNLALADFLLGVYLAFLGAVDVRTRGKSFYKSALTWQMGSGCQLAGFVAIFSSELSVFILTVMTLERLHTIAYSFKRGRMKMRYAVAIVTIGWLLAGSLALLPIFDINTYSDVAICLPFRMESIKDKLFIALVLSLNITAFVIILVCYLQILRLFCLSPSVQQTSRKDKIVISLKMGMLVLTNLICWLPLATVGYAAVFDEHLIDLVMAKFFVILIFPFNACLNPFIYSIFTRHFFSRVRAICKKTDNRLQTANQSSLRISFRRNSIASGSDTASTVRTNSPRCDIDMDALGRRHSRRSFSVQLEPSSIQLPSAPTTSVPYMGRRYSSPAVFATDSSESRPLGLCFSFETELEPSRPSILTNSPGGELHRAHSNCLSVVHEESDCESEVEDIPPLQRQRRYSDPEVERPTLRGIIIRGDKVADTNVSPSGTLCVNEIQQPAVKQLSHTLSVGSTTINSMNTSAAVYRASHHTHHPYQQSFIINPHALKQSKLPLEETQV